MRDSVDGEVQAVKGSGYYWSKVATIGTYTPGDQIQVELDWASDGTLTARMGVQMAVIESVSVPSSPRMILAEKDSSDGVQILNLEVR